VCSAFTHNRDMMYDPCCAVNPGTTDRQVLEKPLITVQIPAVPGRPMAMTEMVALLSREHSALLRNLETTHKVFLSRVAKQICGPGADLISLPDLPKENLQPKHTVQTVSTQTVSAADSAQTINVDLPPVPAVVSFADGGVAPTAPAHKTGFSLHPEYSAAAAGQESAPDAAAVAELATTGKADSGGGNDITHPDCVVESSKGKKKFAKRHSEAAEILKLRQSARGASEYHVFEQIEAFVVGPVFESIFAGLIVANALIMAVEAQYHGIELGFVIQYPGSDMKAQDVWPGAQNVFHTLELLFGVIFVFELVVKISVLRLLFLRSPWNWLDFLIVGGWCLDKGDMGVATLLNPMLLRLVRLVKIARVAKLFKTFQAFDSLSILMSSLRASLSVLFWSIIVLFTIQLASSLIFFQLLQDHITDASLRKDGQADSFKLYEYFGTFTRSFLTMLQLTIGPWPEICRLLTEKVNAWFGIPVVLYVLFVSFCVIKVITAVFIFETQKIASSDEEILILQKDRQTARLEANFAGLFQEIDESGDGMINWEEFEGIITDQRVLTWLAALDLDVHQCEGLFGLLDGGDGKISFQEFVQGVHRLKGPAKSVDLITMSHHQWDMYKDLGKMHTEIQQILAFMSKSGGNSGP